MLRSLKIGTTKVLSLHKLERVEVIAVEVQLGWIYTPNVLKDLGGIFIVNGIG